MQSADDDSVFELSILSTADDGDDDDLMPLLYTKTLATEAQTLGGGRS